MTPAVATSGAASAHEVQRLCPPESPAGTSIAGEYADRMVLLADGRVVAAGPPREVLTENLLAEHYRASVRVVDGDHGPLVVPVRPEPRTVRPAK